MKCIIVDIDGTLANIDHRIHHIRNKPKNWKKFMEGMSEDKPNEDIVDIIVSLSQDYNLFLVTGRSESDRIVTERWLETHGIYYDELFMRPSNDYRQDFIVKEEILREILSRGVSVSAVFEDRDQCVEMYRRNGLTCFQVARGDF